VTATNIPSSYAVTGTLPTGIAFDTGTGQFSGTPTAPGPLASNAYPLQITATNSSGTSAPQNFTLNVNYATPVVTSGATANGTGDTPFNYQITASNLPQTFGVTGALPTGVTLNSSTGLISGTPTQSGTFPVTVSATNPAGTGTKGVTITIAAGVPVITSASSANGQTGQPFSHQITATYSPTSYAISAGALPPGVTLNTSSGLISGTPTTVGTFNVTVSATNATGTGTQPLSIGITLGPPVITSANSAAGGVGNPFTYQITATQSPTSFNASGLPPGLGVNTSTGLISGTPTSGGTFNATVSATNASGTGNMGVTITISVLAPAITSPNSANGQTGVAFSYQITAANGPLSYNASGLPPGLTVDTSTGLISGTPTAVGTFNATVSASNGAGTGSQGVTFNITLGPPVITSASPANGAVGIAFNYQITASNNPTSFNATGLPPGLSVNTSTGLISGTPTTTGAFTVIVSATNATGTGTKSVTMNIAVGAPAITSASSASGQSGQPFSYQITATNAPTSYGASGLPPGVTVNTTTGLVSGTPTTTGTFNASITATNGTGTGSAGLTITITLGPPLITSPATANGATGVAFTYQITALNSPTSFNATGLPPGLGVNTATGLISGTPSTTGTFNATVSATNGVGTGSQSVVFTIVTGPPVITSASLANAQTLVPFSYAITATNSPTTFGAAGLPFGFSVDATTGVISGTTAATGTFNVTLSATNAAGTGTRGLTIVVTVGPPGITSEPTATAAIGQPFSYQIRASNSPTSYGASGLPTGLSVNTTTGVISGTPTAGGTFNVTISASNGTSTVTQQLVITIAFVAPAAANLTVSAVFQTPLTITLPASGQFTQVAIATPPEHGTLSTPSGTTVVYTPAAGYSGPDSFTYTATGPGGTSAPATVTITIGTLPPTAAALTMTVTVNSALTVDVRQFITGSGITGVAIGTSPTHGTASVNGTRITYTPQTGFFGADAFTYVAFGNAGASAPALISVTVVGRTDPTRDADVMGVVAAHAAAADRFARAQIGNFQQRLEALHVRRPEPKAEVEPEPEKAAERKKPVMVASADNLLGIMPAATTSALSSALATSAMSLASSQSLSVNGAAGIGDGTSAWIAGNVRFGHRDANGTTNTRFTSDGVSVGVDRRFGDRLALGVGLGFARDRSDIGAQGSKSDADGKAVAVYGSFQPGARTFVDAVAGYASLDFDSDRFVPLANDFARASRRGDQWFGSIAAGYEHRIEGLLVSPYARLDYASTRLKQATERGAGLNALTYFDQTLRMFEGSVGVRVESQHDTRFGSVRPRARIEFTHDFEGDRSASLAYADDFGTRYIATPAGVKRNALLLGVGSDFTLGAGGLKLGLDYFARRSSHTDLDQGVRLMLTAPLDGKGSSGWFASSSMFSDPVRVEAGYMYDDNVTRGREARNKLADHIFSVNVSKGHVFPVNANLRVVGSLFGGAEELHRYTGLGRVTGGGQAELQYRPSGDFDAITWGVFARIAGDYYDSSIRRGVRYHLAANARRSLTDRIEGFAAVFANVRDGKSAVFDLKDYGAKLNLDYSLGGPNGSLYAAGEYRRGDAVSSGRFSLDNIDVADVFTPDEAFGAGFFAYRFDAKTWIGTLGYNKPLGPRDAIDFSYRRVQTYPNDRPPWLTGPFRYIDNQYSIIYLMRF
jgi:uncharacterized protein YhjY with autotransporter beta-barrel domain